MRYALNRLILKVARVVTVVFVIAAMALSISATAENKQDPQMIAPQCGSIAVADSKTSLII